MQYNRESAILSTDQFADCLEDRTQREKALRAQSSRKQKKPAMRYSCSIGNECNRLDGWDIGCDLPDDYINIYSSLSSNIKNYDKLQKSSGDLIFEEIHSPNTAKTGRKMKSSRKLVRRTIAQPMIGRAATPAKDEQSHQSQRRSIEPDMEVPAYIVSPGRRVASYLNSKVPNTKTIDYSRSASLFALQKTRKKNRLGKDNKAPKQEMPLARTIQYRTYNAKLDYYVMPPNMFPCRRTLKRMPQQKNFETMDPGKKKAQAKRKQMTYVAAQEFQDTRLFRLK